MTRLIVEELADLGVRLRALSVSDDVPEHLRIEFADRAVKIDQLFALELDTDPETVVGDVDEEAVETDDDTGDDGDDDTGGEGGAEADDDDPTDGDGKPVEPPTVGGEVV